MWSVTPSPGRATAPGYGFFVDDECNVHRPVGARHLGEFAGAVERVDDPGALGVEPGKVVLAFLAKHRIVGPLLGESAHQQFVGLAVAFGFEHGRWSVFGSESLAHGEQEFTCFGGEAGGELVIVEGHAAETTRPVWRNGVVDVDDSQSAASDGLVLDAMRTHGVDTVLALAVLGVVGEVAFEPAHL